MLCIIPPSAQSCRMVMGHEHCFPKMSVVDRFSTTEALLVSLALDGVTAWAICKLGTEYCIPISRIFYHDSSRLVDFVG